MNQRDLIGQWKINVNDYPGKIEFSEICCQKPSKLRRFQLE